MIQTESPYYQPTPNPPAPFESAVGIFSGDPAYQNCHCGSPGNDAAWALRIIESSEIYIAGAGLYSWFSTYTQECSKYINLQLHRNLPRFKCIWTHKITLNRINTVKTRSCQNSLIQLEGNGGDVRIFNLITIGATNMITSDGNQLTSQDNLAVDYHPYWSQITIIDPIQKTGPQRLIKQGLHARNEDKCPPVLPEAILPEGKYPTNLSIIDIGGHSDHGYFTLVNGSPYNWILTSSHSYQMDQWKWHNVPAGNLIFLRHSI